MLRRVDFSFVFQPGRPVPGLTAEENVAPQAAYGLVQVVLVF